MELGPDIRRLVLVVDNLEIGGAQRLLEIQVEAMREIHEIMVVNLGPALPLSDRLRELGAVVVDAELRSLYDLPRLSQLLRRVSGFRADLVHAHLQHATLIGRILAAQARAPFVVTVHNEVAEGYGKLDRLKVWLETKVLCRSHAVVACGPRVAQLQKHRVRGAPLVSIANRIKPMRTFTAAERTSGRSELGLSEDDMILLTVGRLNRQKGFDVLLDSFASVVGRHEKAILLIAGEGDDETALRRQADRLGIADRVRFLGAVRDVDRKMAIADVFVLSSRWEGLPLVVLEALASGLAIVATNVGDVAGVTGPEAAVLVEPERPEELAEALRTVISVGDKRGSLQTAARSVGRIHTDFARFVEELEQVYRCAARRQRGRA